MVVMKIKDMGTIKIELYEDIAPITVENFITLVDDGYYDGLTFHRIIPGFMIQGGCPNGTVCPMWSTPVTLGGGMTMV